MTDGEKNSEELSESIVFPIKLVGQSETETDSTGTENSTITATAVANTDTLTENPSFNFSTGTSAFCLGAILKQEQLMIAREKINKEQLEGKSVVENLNNAKRVTSGICYKSGTNRLGKDVFAICKESVDKKKADLMEKMKNNQEDYLKLKREADDLIAAKPIEKFGNKDLNIMLRYLRRDDDKKLPTKKNEMMKLYNS